MTALEAFYETIKVMKKKKKKELGRKSTARNKQGKRAHPLRKEIVGLLFLLIAIILAGSLFSYHPNDRVFWNVTGSVGKAHNLFGTVGAHLAGALFDLLGFSAFWLAAMLLAISFIAFRGKPLSSPIVSIFSAIAILISFSTILSLQFAGEVVYSGGKITAGGLVGLHLAGLAKNVLNNFGAYVLLVSVFIISLMVVTHLSLGRVFSKLGFWILGLFKRFRDLIIKIKERRKRTRNNGGAP